MIHHEPDPIYLDLLELVSLLGAVGEDPAMCALPSQMALAKEGKRVGGEPLPPESTSG